MAKDKVSQLVKGNFRNFGITNQDKATRDSCVATRYQITFKLRHNIIVPSRISDGLSNFRNLRNRNNIRILRSSHHNCGQRLWNIFSLQNKSNIGILRSSTHNCRQRLWNTFSCEAISVKTLRGLLTLIGVSTVLATSRTLYARARNYAHYMYFYRVTETQCLRVFNNSLIN